MGIYFENYNSIFILIIFAILLVGFFLLYRIFRHEESFENHIFSKLRNYKKFKHYSFIKFLLFFFVLIFLMIVILRPQWGTRKETIQAEGVDIMFTLDVSKSMKALDFSLGGQEIDRLLAAKGMVEKFVKSEVGNRYGLVVFAGEAFVSSPLTFDHQAFLTFLESVDFREVEKQGTDLGTALETSMARFVKDEDSKRGRVIILLTDGGDDTKGSYEKVTEKAKDHGIKIYTIGIGSKKGVPIPESKDLFGRVQYKTYNNKVVLTKLNDKPLKKIAKIADSKYFVAKGLNDLEKISEELQSVKKNSFQREAYSKKEDRYQVFLTIAFILFLVAIFFPRGRVFSIAFMMMFIGGCSPSELSFKYHNNKGNSFLSKEYIIDAESEYNKAISSSEELGYISRNNLGIMKYQKMDYEKSKDLIQKSIQEKCDKKKGFYCDQLLYNLGNVNYRIGETKTEFEDKQNYWELAIESYQAALRNNPDDSEAKENIEFIKKRLQEEHQNRDQSENQDSKDGEGQNENADSSEEKKDSNNETDEKDSENPLTEGNGGTQKEENYDLNEDIKNQVKKYMEDMKQSEKRLKGYFHRNPVSNNSNNSDDFLENFFNTNMFQERGKKVDKDW